MSEKPYNPFDDPLRNSPEGQKEHDYDATEVSSVDFNFELSPEAQENKKRFLESLTGNEKWLDLGSGLGTGMVKELIKKKKINPQNLISIDLDIKNLKYQQKRKNTGLKINADAAAIPLEDESIDVLVTHWMMTDNDINKSIKKDDIAMEISRVVRDGGYLITSSYDELYDKVAGEVFKLEFEIGNLRFYKKTN